MSAHTLIVEPFETLAFMRAALVTCLALALTNGAVGTLLVVRRMSLDGDVLARNSHSGVDFSCGGRERRGEYVKKALVVG